jgi:hypothetical protein
VCVLLGSFQPFITLISFLLLSLLSGNFCLNISQPSIVRLGLFSNLASEQASDGLKRVLPLITKPVGTNSEDQRVLIAQVNRGNSGKNTEDP